MWLLGYQEEDLRKSRRNFNRNSHRFHGQELGHAWICIYAMGKGENEKPFAWEIWHLIREDERKKSMLEVLIGDEVSRCWTWLGSDSLPRLRPHLGMAGKVEEAPSCGKMEQSLRQCQNWRWSCRHWWDYWMQLNCWSMPAAALQSDAAAAAESSGRRLPLQTYCLSAVPAPLPAPLVATPPAKMEMISTSSEWDHFLSLVGNFVYQVKV